ncbi:Glycosyl hydrolases family 16 [Sinomicrobium oceani]|uniref:Glycosyl hydrolases family 16 n=1 Tax=Sinomicrobium oceani TaxID=1150368 RepID=A0A1K1NNG3_9FLAO|nr:glycoside hydrolase family 16 protein [Sinomicrobium oceani]SFW36863.1 Glycosyl hydrolases family 16 [Sinomicrobium oceani]
MKNILLFIVVTFASASCSKKIIPQNGSNSTGELLKSAAQTTIRFSGYTWMVKNPPGQVGPHSNYWSKDNVWVDKQGRLHLKITREPDGRWTCAEIQSTENFGYGKYVWKIESRVDQLDKNIVLGLFDYRGIQYSKYDEIDIEFSRWGHAHVDNFSNTVYPEYPKGKSVSNSHELSLNGLWSTYRFIRDSEKVAYSSFHGHTEDPGNAFFVWQTPSGFAVPKVAMPIHMNLWLFDAPPSDGEEVEIIIRSFEFTPL